MSAAPDPVPIDQICIGPIRVVDIFTASPPPDRPVAEFVGTETVPFDQIRHLISRKPLERFDSSRGTIPRS